MCRPSVCPSRLSSHGTWPGLWPMEHAFRSKIEDCSNAPKLLSPSTFVGIDVHAKIGIQIRCVGQVIVAPASRPVARGVSTISSGRKSRIIRNAPKLCSPPTFIGIDVHAKIGIKIRCLGQVLMFPPLVPWHDVFINQERKLGARRRSDTVLVSTINDADQGSADVAFRTPLAPYEKSKSLGSGGSMVARLKLKGIDGRAPPGVEPAA
ncbi:hypothetical protein KIW84_040478 [Lathyrus oleraceus]|uniref:Uncharacterized protein n=1 Tax=Pisum sativum TaxID=3888 RepID=A0A9D4X5L7_PEA|nr:hypothetical protein KIW84_040478 [Pisum sativum]